MTGAGELERTPLHALHVERGGRMGPFAGYDMAVRYEAGPIAEHRHTRGSASLFDVSHMGVVHVEGPDAGAALESVMPQALVDLAVGRMRYCFLTTAGGGIIDDLMVTNEGGRYSMILNASRKADDLAHLQATVGDRVVIAARPDLAVLALQGPASEAALAALAPEVAHLRFLDVVQARVAGVGVGVSRSGYTGEDGFELTVPADAAVAVAEALLSNGAVELAGLAARDSLRLEAGLCLYGNDIHLTTTPVEAALTWAIQRRRREMGGYPGAEVIGRQLTEGPPRQRVGISPRGRKPVRDGATLRSGGHVVGAVTSGGFGATVDRPIAMGYVDSPCAVVGSELVADVRGTDVACVVADLPFVPHRYRR